MAKKSASRLPGGARRDAPGASSSRAAARETRTGRQSDSPQAATRNLLDYVTVRRLIVFFAAVEVVLLAVLFFSPTVRWRNFGALANRAAARGDWDAAREYFEKLAKRKPQLAWVNLDLGRCLAETNRPAEALEHLEVALDHKSELEEFPKRLAQLYAVRAKVLVELNRPEEAVESARNALASDPDQPLANLVLGRYFLEHGRTVEAADCVRYLAGAPEYADEFTSLTARIREWVAQVDPADLADVPERVDLSAAAETDSGVR